MWVHYFTPESKQSSTEWHHKGSLPSKEIRTAVSIMASVFWDSEGVIYGDFLPHFITINAQYYSNLLHNDVHHAIQKKRPG
jgi:hypothetical protein